MGEPVMINRAPVLTMWAAVVAERMGFDWDESLSLGKCLAGLNAQSKGRRLGIYGPPKEPEKSKPAKVKRGEEFWVEVCGRAVPAKNTDEGVRAVVKDKPVDSEPVEKYLRGKFGERFEDALEAMRALAAKHEPDALADEAYGLYEAFRPEIPRGRRGWGAKGQLDLERIRSLGHER